MCKFLLPSNDLLRFLHDNNDFFHFLHDNNDFLHLIWLAQHHHKQHQPSQEQCLKASKLQKIIEMKSQGGSNSQTLPPTDCQISELSMCLLVNWPPKLTILSTIQFHSSVLIITTSYDENSHPMKISPNYEMPSNLKFSSINTRAWWISSNNVHECEISFIIWCR